MGAAAEVLEHARRRLAFLEEEYGLRRREEDGTPVTVLRYVDREIGFEVQLDWREALVDVLVVRLTDGSPPSGGYYLHEGRLIRRHLSEVVAADFPAEAGRLREAARLREKDRTRRMTRELDVIADVLRTVAGDVLRRGQEVIDVPEPDRGPSGDR